MILIISFSISHFIQVFLLFCLHLCSIPRQEGRWEIWVCDKKQTFCMSQCCVLVFESLLNKDAILSLYLECWAVWTFDSCRRFAAHSILHWWWWLSPGNTSMDMYFHFILVNPDRSISCKNKLLSFEMKQSALQCCFDLEKLKMEQVIHAN